ncbi:MAG: SDR family oxidoreductase [Chloroflexi bacterium]|nr:SDR family oxidoreductase [Chloroflexota bacterium]MXX84389.1 SDR family oxidoreductase [Chloroflexota bacterium]MYA92847.1 SDR family oxidoreductase [Chloroflexota bacterium]MYD37532.1 SDR family oxidoreductase [Chloroflexota bacterium]MYE77761.1 SDR family oxidoreductase [Chloroflexota bacterium]
MLAAATIRVMESRPITLLTGAGSGIGRGFALAMAQLGNRVIITDIDQSSAESVAAEVIVAGGLAQARQFDVTDGEAARGLVQGLVDRYGRIDHLFANAGVLGPTDFWEIRPEDWAAVLGVNISGAAIICQLVAAQMKKQRRGRIILTASYNGVRVDKHVIPYRVSKAGLLMFTKCLALVMAPYDVTVNAICPGVTLTPLQQAYAQALADQRGISLDDYLDERRSVIPMGELTTTADLNALARFLVSDEARLITGQSIAVDGGVMASS